MPYFSALFDLKLKLGTKKLNAHQKPTNLAVKITLNHIHFVGAIIKSKASRANTLAKDRIDGEHTYTPGYWRGQGVRWVVGCGLCIGGGG